MLGPGGNIKHGNQNAVKQRVGDLKMAGNSKTDNKDAFKWVLTFLHSPVHCESFVLVHIYYSVIKASYYQRRSCVFRAFFYVSSINVVFFEVSSFVLV